MQLTWLFLVLEFFLDVVLVHYVAMMIFNECAVDDYPGLINMSAGDILSSIRSVCPSASKIFGQNGSYWPAGIPVSGGLNSQRTVSAWIYLCLFPATKKEGKCGKISPRLNPKASCLTVLLTHSVSFGLSVAVSVHLTDWWQAVSWRVLKIQVPAMLPLLHVPWFIFKKQKAKLSALLFHFFSIFYIFCRFGFWVFCWFGLHKVCLTFILRSLCAFCMTRKSFFWW